MTAPDMQNAADALRIASDIISSATASAASLGAVDDHQVFLYDLAHAASAVEISRSLIDYGTKGEVEGNLACAFISDALADLNSKIFGREQLWGTTPGVLDAAREFITTYREPDFVASLATVKAPSHLDDEFDMVADTFRRFGEDKIAPAAEHIHRADTDIPEEIIQGLAELGCFGLSVPEQYGGFATGSESDYGSDVANLKVSATRADGGWVINGVKTWCTFAGRADVLMLLARTDPDRTKTHRGLSLFIVPKPQAQGHSFEFTQDSSDDTPGSGTMEGRAIPTLGYRGMHSFEIAFDNWFVPADNQVGGEEGLGKGFYMQMAGFENGRLQTAARAVGVMQAAYDEARQYAEDRSVFGEPVMSYQLTQVKLGRMAAIIAGSRQYSYTVAQMMAKGEGALEASMIKAYVCKAAEWVTREALQIHGGFGFAEEYTVSRLFVDARVLSIFEGADETLCLKVIARRLIAESS